MSKGKDPTIDRAAAARTAKREEAKAAEKNAVKLSKVFGRLGKNAEKN